MCVSKIYKKYNRKLYCQDETVCEKFDLLKIYK